MAFVQQRQCARFLVMVAASIVALAWLASVGRAEQGLMIEPEVQRAHAAALQRFPEPIRARLAGVPVLRQSRYEVPENAPLAWRLMAQAAYAVYSNSQQSVVIFDAALAGESRWDADLTGQEHRATVAAFLDSLAAVLEGEPGDTEALWASFVAKVAAWEEPAERSATTPVLPMPADPPVGCPIVFDAFVRKGVARAMGRVPELEGLIVHELAHAMQIRDGGYFATQHMRAWGRLSGWHRADKDERFDGYAYGGFRMENPEVLISLLLSDDPAAAERMNAIYKPGPDAAFINRYARYDPREDFAECVRWMVWWPDELIALSPERFMFINAMGWCLDLDVASPGPLWFDAAAIEAKGWSEALHAAAGVLVEPPAGASLVDAYARAALLRAHAPALEWARLPQPSDRLSFFPNDLPADDLEAMRLDLLTPKIDGSQYPMPESMFYELVDEYVVAWFSRIEFEAGMNELFLPMLDAEGVDLVIAEIESKDSIRERVRELRMLIAEPNVWAVAEQALREAVDRASRRCSRGLATVLSIAMALQDPATTAEVVAAKRRHLARIAWDHLGVPIDEYVEAYWLLAELLVAYPSALLITDNNYNYGLGDSDLAALERIISMKLTPDVPVSLIRYTEYTIARIEDGSLADRPADLQRLVDMAKQNLNDSPYPKLRALLSGRLERALEAASESADKEGDEAHEKP